MWGHRPPAPPPTSFKAPAGRTQGGHTKGLPGLAARGHCWPRGCPGDAGLWLLQGGRGHKASVSPPSAARGSHTQGTHHRHSCSRRNEGSPGAGLSPRCTAKVAGGGVGPASRHASTKGVAEETGSGGAPSCSGLRPHEGRGTRDGGPGPAPLSTCKRCLGRGRGKCAGSRERRNSFSGVLSSPARDSEQRELESQSRGSANHRQDSTRHLEADPDPKLPTRIGRERALTQCSCKTFMYLRSLFE